VGGKMEVPGKQAKYQGKPGKIVRQGLKITGVDEKLTMDRKSYK